MPKPISELPELQVIPATHLEKRTRRRFSQGYKLRIIAEADACQRGELGALLRREKLYNNQLQQWRRELAEHGIDGVSKSAKSNSYTNNSTVVSFLLHDLTI